MSSILLWWVLMVSLMLVSSSTTGPVLLQLTPNADLARFVEKAPLSGRYSSATSLLEKVRDLAEQRTSLDNVSVEVLRNISQLMNSTVYTEIFKGHAEDQAEILRMKGLVDECDAKYAQEQALSKLQRLNTTRKEHSSCRSGESLLHQEKTEACTLAEGNISGFKETVCSQTSEAWASSTIDALTLRLSRIKTLEDNCSEAKRSLSKKTATCRIKQALFEESACVYADALEHAWEDYGECRSNRINDYNSTVLAVQGVDKSRASELIATQRIVCYFDVLSFKGTQGERHHMLNLCANKTVDTSPVVLQYPTINQSLSRTTSNGRPCDATWMGSEYGGLPSNAPAGPCRACPTTSTTTSATTSTTTSAGTTTSATTTEAATTVAAISAKFVPPGVDACPISSDPMPDSSACEQGAHAGGFVWGGEQIWNRTTLTGCIWGTHSGTGEKTAWWLSKAGISSVR